MKIMNDLVFNAEAKASEWFEKFKDKIKASEERTKEAVIDFNKKLILDQRKNKRLKESLADEKAMYIFVRENGYQVVNASVYMRLSKTMKNKLEKEYILYGVNSI